MASNGHRWQAAMGALAGTLLVEAVRDGSDSWGPVGDRALGHAYGLLDGGAPAIDLSPNEAVPAALRLAGEPPPLLADPATVELIEVAGELLDGPGGDRLPRNSLLASTLTSVRAEPDWTAAVSTADREHAVLVGGLHGITWGLGAVPARPLSALRSPDGRNARRQLTLLSRRLIGEDRPNWYDPRNRRGPREVLPGLWLSNIHGVAGFTREHENGLVLSLCDTEGRTGDHEPAITFHLDDTPDRRANPRLALVLDDILGEIAAARADGLPVLVHCRHGASRTGLVLRALLADELGLTPEDALTEAQCLWPHTSTWNTAWHRILEERAQ